VPIPKLRMAKFNLQLGFPWSPLSTGLSVAHPIVQAVRREISDDSQCQAEIGRGPANGEGARASVDRAQPNLSPADRNGSVQACL
jgi:hypothetical protein